MAVLLAFLLMVGILVYQVAFPSKGELQERKMLKALASCQHRIAGLAQYGDAEMPPFTKNYGKGDEFYFAWPRGSFHFKNGFGASLPMSASCIGIISTGKIKQLTINGAPAN